MDDNPSNLREALHFVPELQVADDSLANGLLDDPRFKGKDDTGLSRLTQYKNMEQRVAERAKSGVAVTDFLRRSNIRIVIEYDVDRHIDRAIELINRTNQLNFTKMRLPEEANTARAELRHWLNRHSSVAGLVRVSDNYGDHGFCGLFVVHSVPSSKTMIHYCWSCRILGMGVEKFVYDLLGQPSLDIVGEVLSDPTQGPTVDWISVSEGGNVRAVSSNMQSAQSMYLRGGCDLMSVGYYAAIHFKDVVGEYDILRDGINLRLDHSAIARLAIEGVPRAAMNDLIEIGYSREDFESTALTTQAKGIRVFSFGPDFWLPSFRHKATGTVVPYCFHLNGHVTDPLKVAPDGRGALDERKARAVNTLARNFESAGFTGEVDFKQNVRTVLRNVPMHSRAYVILSRDTYGDDNREAPPAARLNRWLIEVVSEFENAAALPISQFAKDSSEMFADGHLSRIVYFRLFEHIKSIGA